MGVSPILPRLKSSIGFGLLGFCLLLSSNLPGAEVIKLRPVMAALVCGSGNL